MCNNLQKWNNDKCKCEYLKIKDCNIGYSRNVNNCRCEMKKLAALIETEECDVEIDEVKNCKPFIGVSVLFLCVSVTLTGIMIYFHLKSKNKYVLPY